ncbi:glycosyltransferase family 2 protein [Pseudomonas matsuisoli]|uniref:Glycosyl transferase family A n=1 Tax=Pseudomonas matsuisoli TaxID=1515666 RepID=A0A917PTX9_9PSED|nr:galactosyltransferase-related protein [Pseudomonas matsuisoli]GGJ91755.1 glycosyl transferase family A [Pseudomonas matsuisoli]
MTQTLGGLPVITVVKGRRAQLANLITGLEQSSHPPARLLIVFMDEAADSLYSDAFPIDAVSVMGTGELPLARARNCVRQIPAPAWVFLDVDCIPSVHLLRDYATALSARPEALHLGEVRYLPKGAADYGWTEATFSACAARHPLSDLRPAPGASMAHELFWSLNFACSSDVFDCIGGFDEAYEGYGAEDTDFAFRARARNVPLLCASALAYHQYHSTYRPPLNHFASIIANAQTFHTRWQTWPMEGWLREFADRGLVHWQADRLEVIRQPTETEVRDCFDQALKGF